MPADDLLKEYRRRQGFFCTAEPSGSSRGKERSMGDAPRFVIQEHHSRRKPTSTRPGSVPTGRSLAGVAAQEGDGWPRA